jgi:hypothetical protein
MTTKKDKQKELKKNNQFETSLSNDNKVVQKETPVKNDSDTEPDEFISPNADTDLPIEGQVINDAVLRGEPHADDKARNWPPQDKRNKSDMPQKKDAEKEGE